MKSNNVLRNKRSYTLSDEARQFMQALKKQESETALDRYNRLYSNSTYKEFQEWAIWTFGSSYLYATNLLTDAAIELCFIYLKEKPSERIEGSVERLAKHLKNQGVSLNFAAIIHLRNFHTDALEIFCGKQKS